MSEITHKFEVSRASGSKKSQREERKELRADCDPSVPSPSSSSVARPRILPPGRSRSSRICRSLCEFFRPSFLTWLSCFGLWGTTESESSFFVISLADPVFSSCSPFQLDRSFGLLDESPERWSNLKKKVAGESTARLSSSSSPSLHPDADLLLSSLSSRAQRFGT